MKPSVTNLIQLLDKPALLNWANKIGLQGIKIDDYRKKSLSSGSSLHKQIENYVLHKVPFEKPENEINFNNFLFNKKIIDIEKKIETEYFTGRIDIKISINGFVYLCDFKSNQKYIYFENKLQLAAYSMAENCDGFAIISIPDFTFIPFAMPSKKSYQEIIINLSNIYKLKKQIENETTN